MKLKYTLERQEVLDKTFAVYTGDDGKSHMITLEGVATDILDGIEHGLDEEEIVGKLLEDYDVSEDKLRADVHSFVGELDKQGLLV